MRETVMQLGFDDSGLKSTRDVVESAAQLLKRGRQGVDVFGEAVLRDEVDDLEGLHALALDEGFRSGFDGLAGEDAQRGAEQRDLRRDLQRAFFVDEALHIGSGEADHIPGLLGSGGLQHARRHGDVREEGRGEKEQSEQACHAVGKDEGRNRQ